MKRIRIDEGWHEYGENTKRPRKRPGASKMLVVKNCTPAERDFIELLEDARLATEAERAAWARLEQYLADGIVPPRGHQTRQRVRIE